MTGDRAAPSRAGERVYTTPLLDKLGVKSGSRVALMGMDEESFTRELRSRTADVNVGAPGAGTDLVFLAADSIDELGPLSRLRSHLKPNGAIWVVSRKGKQATLRDVDVIGAAKSAGLVDNKVVSFSETHTALRLVIPRELRPR